MKTTVFMSKAILIFVVIQVQFYFHILFHNKFSYIQLRYAFGTLTMCVTIFGLIFLIHGVLH